MVISGYEEKVYEFLSEILPFVRVERQHFVNYKGTKLYFDFYLPAYKIVIEVQGIQHYQFVEFFHGDNKGWKDSKGRDSMKYEWALECDIIILELDTKAFPKTSTELLDLMIEALNKHV